MIAKKQIIAIFSMLLICSIQISATVKWIDRDSTLLLNSTVDNELIEDTIIDIKLPEHKPLPTYNYLFLRSEKKDSIHISLIDDVTFNHRLDSLGNLPKSQVERLLFSTNPLVLPLVFIGDDMDMVWNGKIEYKDLTKKAKKYNLTDIPVDSLRAERIVKKLRDNARIYLANKHLDLYAYNVSDLPDVKIYKYRLIETAKINTIELIGDKFDAASHRIHIEKAKPMYWIKKANAILQFSQNFQTPNWHKGGNNNVASLASFIVELNYDNLKNKRNVIWENKIEWRAGFNSVEGDTLRKVAVNDDILRYITKFGVKAGGNWYYSISGEINTLLFDNFKKINSKEYKGRLLTPVRANLGVGMNYKHKNLFSLMVAPLSLKYVYVDDTKNVNPNIFGIKKGENQLKQFGSSLNAQLKYSPLLNWDINSRLTFYTNYQKVEIDWEIVNTFIINRFLTARLLLNPRYDNTVILKKGEKARIQFKEYMSLGFSFRLI